jgi:putative nucleotidyltransferase with HDIG domain
VATTAHLVRRFLGSLWPAGPSSETTRAALAELTAPEAELWLQMSGPDRRHSAAVAGRVRLELGAGAPRAVIAAALLHDVGKLDSSLGTFARVGATMVSRARAAAWTAPTGWRLRVARYLDHASIGAAMLDRAGSDPLTVAWARDHHRRVDEVTVDPRFADALRAADDD